MGNRYFSLLKENRKYIFVVKMYLRHVLVILSGYLQMKSTMTGRWSDEPS